ASGGPSASRPCFCREPHARRRRHARHRRGAPPAFARPPAPPAPVGRFARACGGGPAPPLVAPRAGAPSPSGGATTPPPTVVSFWLDETCGEAPARKGRSDLDLARARLDASERDGIPGALRRSALPACVLR